MAPLTLAVDTKTPSKPSSDAPNMNMLNFQLQKGNPFASVSMKEEKPFDFLRALFEGVIAGGTAGVVVETALYPIDTIKTRLQAAQGGGKIILKGLYSGLAGNIAGVLPASALFIGVYEPTKQKLLRMLPDNLSAVAHLTAGAVGGFAASLVRVPTEVVKQRMQTGQFASAPNAVRLIVSNEGFKGLYAGYGSFLLRDLPFDAIQFCIYEQLRIGYKAVAQRELKDYENAIIGAFSGALTGAVTTPLDVVKTRMMIQGSANKYKGIMDCVQTVVREEGPSALLKGLDKTEKPVTVTFDTVLLQLAWPLACMILPVCVESCKHAIKLVVVLCALALIVTLYFNLTAICRFRMNVQNTFLGLLTRFTPLGIGPRVTWIGIGGAIFFGVLESTKQVLAEKYPAPTQDSNSKQD